MKKRKRITNGTWALVLICCVLGVFLMRANYDTVIAYLQQQSFLPNTFTVGNTDVAVEETFDGQTKKNVAVKNNGNIPVYIRVKLICSWQNMAGKTVSGTPAPGTDYEIMFAELGDSGSWFEYEGYYYFKQPVDSGNKTEDLITSCTQKNNLGTRKLVVDVICQSVQAAPAIAVAESWPGIEVSDGQLTIVTP